MKLILMVFIAASMFVIPFSKPQQSYDARIAGNGDTLVVDVQHDFSNDDNMLELELPKPKTPTYKQVELALKVLDEISMDQFVQSQLKIDEYDSDINLPSNSPAVVKLLTFLRSEQIRKRDLCKRYLDTRYK